MKEMPWPVAALLIGGISLVAFVGGASVQRCTVHSHQRWVHQCESLGVAHHCVSNTARYDYENAATCRCLGPTGAQLEYANTWRD